MDIQQLILDALGQSPNAIPYFVSQRLKRYFPDHVLLEASDRDFDLHGYGEAGHCQIHPLAQVHGQELTTWNSSDRHIEKQPFNAAFEMTWQGHPLIALQLHWAAGWSTVRYLWLLSEREAIAEAFFHAVCDWSTEVRDEILIFDNGNWSKNTELFKSIESTTLENLVLPGSLKQDIHSDVKRFFESRQFYSQHGLAWKRGLLLIGPPGNGKTHMVKALINDLKLPCLYVKNFKDRSNPEAFNIRRVFEKARNMAPCILVLEDLDSLMGNKISVAFLEVNEEGNKLLLSERNAARAIAMSTINKGELITGTIGSLKPFGAFVDFEGGASGLLHIKQISKSYVSALGDVFSVGDPVKAIVLNIDDQRGRISLSTQVLEKYPGEMLKEKDTLMAEAEERAKNVANTLAKEEG